MQISGADNLAHHLGGSRAVSQGRSARGSNNNDANGSNVNGARQNNKAIASYENHSRAVAPRPANGSERPTSIDHTGQSQSLSKPAPSQPDPVTHATYQRHSSSAHFYRPDSAAHVARHAIAAYTSTQYIEERNHFTQVLGVDEYA